jgi:hypothetical protein
VDTNYSVGWLWAYKSLQQGRKTKKEVEEILESGGYVMGAQYAAGARAGIADWEAEIEEMMQQAGHDAETWSSPNTPEEDDDGL